MKKRIFYIIPVLILVLGFIIMQILVGMKDEPQRRAPERVVKQVRSEIVKLEDTPTQIEALGKVLSSSPVQLISEVTGVLLPGDVPFKPGQRFSRGQVLLRIDNRQVQYTLNSTKSDFMNALATVLPEMKIDHPADYDVWQKYFDGCGFDDTLAELPESTHRRIKVLLTRANVYKLFFAVRNLEITLEKHDITAPFNGSISMTTQRVGSNARNGSVLGEIISLQDLEVEIPIPAEDIAWVRSGSDVILRSEEFDNEWKGRIVRTGDVVDRQTQTIPLYVSVNGTGRPLYEGSYLTAWIPGRAVTAGVTVPRRALYEERYVYVITNGQLEIRDVTIARRNPESVVVSAGLSEGDTLVTELLQGVSPGMLAQPRLRGIEERPQ
ncbi:MAG: hypothetical protein C0600_13945 [Ignavibacteria bacterium]|nr:MAG: hypothetical protein C0600_13945 [Ignavibacteria bacterium]